MRIFFPRVVEFGSVPDRFISPIRKLSRSPRSSPTRPIGRLLLYVRMSIVGCLERRKHRSEQPTAGRNLSVGCGGSGIARLATVKLGSSISRCTEREREGEPKGQASNRHNSSRDVHDYVAARHGTTGSQMRGRNMRVCHRPSGEQTSTFRLTPPSLVSSFFRSPLLPRLENLPST